MRNKRILLTFFCYILVFVSCTDSVLEQEVQDYCSCIDQHKQYPEERYKCIEMMQNLQEKYSDQPRKLNAIVDKTSNCN